MITATTPATLVRALERAMEARCPEIASAIDWLRSTDMLLDLDDAKLAAHNAECVLASLEVEATESDWIAAAREGALMTDEEWDAIDAREQCALDRAMDDGLRESDEPAWMVRS